MAGRRRRPSNSTVATVDETNIRYSKEATILKPVHVLMPDSEWPCFVLTDAQVFRSDGKTLANPLHVDLEGPMIIRGKLVISDDDEELVPCLVRSTTRSAYIEIHRSERYSIGYQPVTLWVSGLAGWFEIVPSPEYEAMHKEVQEAITLYYSIMEAYDDYEKACVKARKKKKAPPPMPQLDDVLLNYALTLGDGIFRDEAEARCHKWAQFFIAHFPKEGDLSWEGTAFAEWMHKSHPDLKQKIIDTAAGKIPPVPIPPAPEPVALYRPTPRRRRSPSATTSPLSSLRTSEDVEMADPAPVQSTTTVPQVADKGIYKARPLSNTPIPLPSYLRSTQQPQPQTPAPKQPSPTPRIAPSEDAGLAVETLWDVIKETALEAKNMQKTKPSKYINDVFFKCKIREYRWRMPIVAFYAKDLLPLLDTPKWQNTPLYEWARDTALNPVPLPEDLKPEDIPSQLTRRKVKEKTTKKEAVPSPVPELKSRPNYYVKAWDEEESEDDLPPIPGSRRSGKGAILRPSASKKRPASELDDDSINDSRRGRKKSKRNRIKVEEEEDWDDSSDLGSVKDEDHGSFPSFLPPASKEAVRVVVHAERVPTMSPSGPNGTWVCDQEDCGYVVRAAEESAGQEQIQNHFKWHESQSEKINLAVAESRGQMPINHLLEKLQKRGEAIDVKKRGSLPNGELLKPPIKRKLINF